MEDKKMNMIIAWLIFGIIVGILLITKWYYWALFVGGIWETIALAISWTVLGLIILIPLAFAIIATIKYLRCKNKEDNK